MADGVKSLRSVDETEESLLQRAKRRAGQGRTVGKALKEGAHEARWSGAKVGREGWGSARCMR
ncbi:hypothetical protein FH972_021767 [Carpinus fangiana]|uniref:Uncharacterized protein n=1 Tax=Carpinus fangiana TaxID=176857 RepID=A0A5N6KQU5_9ROSI|nr:hypothetical protein FH972_021767 [Carpinus fangiana]